MQIQYVVHTATLSPVQAQAEVNGQTMEVTVNAAVIELVSEDETMAHSFKFLSDVEAVMAEFTPGRAITVTLDPQ